MANQAEMFGDPYAPFAEGLPDDYPRNKFRPLHKVFRGKATVVTGTQIKRSFKVDLDIGECNCKDGYAWGVDTLGSKGWYERAYCIHKLRTMAVIIEKGELDGFTIDEGKEARAAYLKALGTRYNTFEAVSAFHKELRRGDFKQAWFWGLILTTKRGMRGLFQYMLNIIYEETRDHDLADYLLACRMSPRMQTLSSACKAISWFCATPKKWELPRRFAIFQSEMRGYKALVKDYGPDVAKGGNIIADAGAKAKLLHHMEQGARTGDMVQFQRGLKGLQKLNYTDRPKGDDKQLQIHRFWIYERLYELGEELHGDNHDMWRVVAFVNARIAAEQGIGYHELNAIGDALMGEPVDAGLLPPDRLKIATARPCPGIPLMTWPAIPLYAHDNHTWAGKRLMSRHPEQLLPGRKQEDLDFRYCGAYFGVAYRMISQREHGRVADWHETKWDMELHRIVMSLWY